MVMGFDSESYSKVSCGHVSIGTTKVNRSLVLSR